MNTNKSKRFVNVLAGAIAAAGILGGGALGLAAGANADTATPAQAHDTGQSHETDQRTGTPTPPVAHRPSHPTSPGQHPTHQRPR